MADQAEKNLILGCRILGLSNAVSNSAREQWVSQGRPPLAEMFPYFVHCLKIELFFHVAVDKTLISPDRASNKIDITYLFYLPFCRFFMSNDKLHKRSSVLFLNAGQEFVDGAELKAGLQEICRHYSLLVDEIEAEGMFRVAKSPPLGPESLSTKLWKRASFPANGRTRAFGSSLSAKTARNTQTDGTSRSDENPKIFSEIRERIESMKAGAPLEAGRGLNMSEIDQVAIERKIPLRRGRWRLLPKDIEKEKV